MRLLLVYPEFPTTYWGFQHSMPLVGKRASLPPLGLISLAALLPSHYEMRLVDLNVELLEDAQILWADVVCVSAMRIQADAARRVLTRARRLGRRTVIGGPAPTTSSSEFAAADLVFAGEAEGRIDSLVAALEGSGDSQPRVLRPDGEQRPEMDAVPIPRFDLLDLSHYTSASVQYSRGCPFNCEFCDIIEIFGRKARVKTPQQLLAELDALYSLGWRRSVFVVDDNFIGNRHAAKRLLPQLADWQRQRSYPFELFTEASVNLARDEPLMQAMVDAGFAAVFLGIETTDVDALLAAGKRQNTVVDLHRAVQRLCEVGMEVMGGFIVGFDSDTPRTFEAQRRFIANSPIALAMIGPLIALPGTQLWRRLSREGRLRGDTDGDQFGRPNFVPAMDEAELLAGYAELLRDLYTPESYYARCRAHVDRVARVPGRKRLQSHHVATVLRTVVQVGFKGRRKRHFWSLVAHALRNAPHALPWVFANAIKGEHMIRYTEEQVLPRLERALEQIRQERAEQQPRNIPRALREASRS